MPPKKRAGDVDSNGSSKKSKQEQKDSEKGDVVDQTAKEATTGKDGDSTKDRVEADNENESVSYVSWFCF